MTKIEIKATARAQQKYNEIVNGSKKEIGIFFKNLKSGGLNKEDFEFMFEVEKDKFYSKKCKNVYIIFLIDDEKSIIIVDFLTEIEYNNLMKNKETK